MKLLVEKATIWNGSDQLIDRGSILIDGGRIQQVFNQAEAANLKLPPNVERIDGTGKLAIPGLINAHTHLYSSLARGIILPNYAPHSFTQILQQLWWRLDKALNSESIRVSGTVGAMEAARCGVTTLIDHHASPHAVLGSLAVLRDAVCDQVGLRAAFCYEVSDRDGPEICKQGIAENKSFLSEQVGDNRLAAGLFGLHAAFTLSDETLSHVAQSLTNDSGVHIHVAEGPEDEQISLERYKVRIVERLRRFGLVKQTSILAHCLHIDEQEKNLIADSNAIVVHNPRSNMNNAVGTFDLAGLLDREIVVGLGTDGVGENMLSELFTASLLQKHARQDPLAAGFPSLHALLHDNNQEIVRRVFGVKVGRIAAGFAADIALIRYTSPTPITASNILGHLLFGLAVHAIRVSDLLVAGQPILKDGQFVDLDEEKIYAHAQEEATKLWQRAA